MTALPSPAPVQPGLALFGEDATEGWIELSQREGRGRAARTVTLLHWAEQGGVLCGQNAEPLTYTVHGTDRLARFVHTRSGQCPATPSTNLRSLPVCGRCHCELVRREFHVPFRVGQRVESRAQGMVLRGRIADIHLDGEGKPLLDITREWSREPKTEEERQDQRDGNQHWYRSPQECKPLKEETVNPSTSTTRPTRTTRKGVKPPPSPAVPMQPVAGTELIGVHGRKALHPLTVVTVSRLRDSGRIELREFDNPYVVYYALNHTKESLRGKLVGRHDSSSSMPHLVRFPVNTDELAKVRSAQSSAAPAPTPTASLVNSFAPGDLVLVELGGGEPVPGVVWHQGSAGTAVKIFQEGEITTTSVRAALLRPHSVPWRDGLPELCAGDSITVQPSDPASDARAFAGGYIVSGPGDLPGTVRAHRVGDDEDVQHLLRDVSITGRENLAHAYLDLGWGTEPAQSAAPGVEETAHTENPVITEPSDPDLAEVAVSERGQLCLIQVPGTNVRRGVVYGQFGEDLLTVYYSSGDATEVGVFPPSHLTQLWWQPGKFFPGDFVATRFERPKRFGVVSDVDGSAVKVKVKSGPSVEFDQYRLTLCGSSDFARACELLKINPEQPSLTPVEVVAVPVQPLPAEPEPRFKIPKIDPPRTGLLPIPWNKLLPWKGQPRKRFLLLPLQQLALDIAERGLLHPPLVRPHPERPGFYQIVAGERRYRASGLLVKGLEVGEGADRRTITRDPDHELICQVRDIPDGEMLLASMQENITQDSLSPMEQARGFAGMLAQGMTVGQIHALTLKPRRTIQRLADIAVRLVPELQDLFEQGNLPAQHAEVLCLAGPTAQREVWKESYKGGALPALDDLKARLQERLFRVDQARFPRDRYTGAVQEADLYDAVPAHFVDFEQAMRLQQEHAIGRARQAVRDGAGFADVIVQREYEAWKYTVGEGGTGVVFWINSRTGQLDERRGLLSFHRGHDKPLHRELGAQPEDRHETRAKPNPSSASRAAQPAPADSERHSTPLPAALPPERPSYADGALHYLEQVRRACLSDPNLNRALFLWSVLGEAVEGDAEVVQAMQDAARLTDALLEVRDGVLTSTRTLHDALPALLALPNAVLDTLIRAHLAALIFNTLEGDALLDAQPSSPLMPAFQLDAEYLTGCNRAALEELYQDAALTGFEKLDQLSDDELRRALLAQAEALAGSGFLPAPLRGEA